MAARLEIEIDGANAGLKKSITDSLSVLTRFSSALNFKPDGVNSLNTALSTTKSLLQDISALSSSVRNPIASPSGSSNNQSQELNAARVATENYRTESARLSSELQALRLQTAQNRQSTTAAAGSYREAQQRLTALGRSIREAEGGFRSTNPSIREQIREYRNLNRGLADFDAEMGNHQRNVGNYKSALGGLKTTLVGLAAGAFSIGAISNFGKQVISVTSEFQKFQAVLGNTLGSNALADLKLKEIQDFAAKTPFGIQELTGAFVKLANSGFKPTGDQMRSLGDLAASTGKSFDQLAEAILDAQTGEFERLKEFGVRAKDAGDKVIFTYKGVQTTVDKTSASIRNYITDIGNAAGVSGSMAKISETLGGQISNLGDNWDQMLLSVGGNTEGVFKESIGFISAALNELTNFNRELETIGKFDLGSKTGAILDTLFKYSAGGIVSGAVGKGTRRTEDARKILDAQDAVSSFVSKSLGAAKTTADFGEALANLKKQGDQTLSGIKDPKILKGVSEAYQKGVTAIIDARNNFNNQVEGNANFGKGKGDKKGFSLADTMEQLRKAIELTGVQFQSTFDERNNGKIAAYQSAINAVTNALGAQSSVVKELQKQQQNLFQLTPLKSVSAVSPDAKKQLEKAASQIEITGKVAVPDLFNKEAADIAKNAKRELNRAIMDFGTNFYRTLSSINQLADRSFIGVVGVIGENITGMLNDTFGTQLSRILQDFTEKGKISFKDLGVGLAGIAGGLISGISSKKSSVGQGVGGALTGAAAGFALGGPLGAAVGGLAGAIGGLLGAGKARKEQEALQKQQLDEAKKQTELLRQNALTYTSSIVGRMTDQGVVTNVDVGAQGTLIATVNGKQIDFVLGRTNNSRG